MRAGFIATRGHDTGVGTGAAEGTRGRVTPLVLLLLKLEHNIISIGISCVLTHLECVH
jgi:hypothetical protein